ncbi:MAG: hypothetical protein IPN48_10010 [Sphingomonadales bacterium]|nr:hypothetical protein [Sphingomonadales bacterium]
MSWPGFALRDDGGPISTTIIDQYAVRLPLPGLAQAGQAGRHGHQAAAALRSALRQEFLRGRGVIPSVELVVDDNPLAAYAPSNIAARPRRSGVTGPISRGSCPCSAHNGMQPLSGGHSTTKQTPGSASLLVTIMRATFGF